MKPSLTLFAIQLCRCETPAEVAGLTIKKASDLGVTCSTLEVLDVITVGSVKYVRMATDMGDTNKVAEALYSLHRAVVFPVGGAATAGYPVRVAGRSAILPYSRMSVTSFTPPVVYRGCSIPQWELQFPELKDLLLPNQK